MSDAPERVWLQWEDHAGENTWCADQINDEDFEYIRADLHAAENEALRKENERLTEVADVAQEATKFARLDRDMYKAEVDRLREVIAYHYARNGVAADIARDVFTGDRARAALQGETE